MKEENNRSFIEESEFYRGQIVYEWDRTQILGTKTNIIHVDSFNPYDAFDSFYDHQNKLISFLHSGKNVLFLAPFNTGRTTISLLYSLDILFNKQKSVLIVSANSFEKELEEKLLNKILIASKLDWLVDIHDIKEESDKEEYFGVFPSIFIAEIRDLHWFLLPNHSKYASLFESIGLIIYDDFEKFSGNLSSNLHYINKRLRILLSYYNKEWSSLQYLVLSKAFHESKRIVESIFEKEFEILSSDGKEINPAKVFYWIPALDKVDIRSDNKNKTLVRTTQRDSFLDDSYILAIESLKKGKNTVIYYSNIPFSKNDIKKQERFLNYFKRSEQISDFNLDNLFIGYDWSDLTNQIVESGLDWEQIDTLIIAMFSGGISEIRDNFLHVGKTGSEIFVTMPQIPSFQYEINHPSIDIIKDIKDTVKGEHISIFAFSKSENLFEKHKLLSAYEIKNITDDNIKSGFYEEWSINELDREILDKCDKCIKRVTEVTGFDIYSTEYENYYTLLNSEGKILGTVDLHEIPDSYFKNAVVCSQNERFKVSEIDLITKKIKMIPLEEFNLLISKRMLEKTDDKSIRNYKYSDVSFVVKKLKTNTTFNNYAVIYGTDPQIDSSSEASEDLIKLNELQITGIEISGFNNAKAFADIFNISLNTKLSLYNLSPNYFTYGSSSFFYNLGGDDLQYLINDNNVKELLERALTILIDCPCTNGCNGCLINFKTEKNDFSKKELIEYLGKLLKKDNLENILRWKYEGIGQIDSYRKDMIKCREVRVNIFNILNYKASMFINDPFQEKFISSDDAKWISSVGLCHGGHKTVYIRPGFREDIFTEICAHEYTHNWQFEGNLHPLFQYFNKDDTNDKKNIWFEGKIFIEGQANFFAAKVMDYYGLRDMVYANEVQSYGQYREGLILLNYLEKKFGLIKLNYILKESKFDESTPVTKDDINLWYDDSGVKNLIRGLADELIKKNMRCIQKEFLDKSRDFNRLTYFMNLRIDSRDKKLSKYISEANLTEDEAFPKIWKILKSHFLIVPNKNYDYLPCKDCAFKNEESLDGLCIMFGSISVRKEIEKELGISGNE